jgi:hypothetical protein
MSGIQKYIRRGNYVIMPGLETASRNKNLENHQKEVEGAMHPH